MILPFQGKKEEKSPERTSYTNDGHSPSKGTNSSAESAKYHSHNYLLINKVFSLAESLGGVESLINHPATMTHGSVPKEDRERVGFEDNLLRLSVGVEDYEDLIADLENALKESK